MHQPDPNAIRHRLSTYRSPLMRAARDLADSIPPCEPKLGRA